MTREPREALISWRQSTGYSQGEVGALFKVSKSAVGWWETGRARVPARVQRRLAAEGWLPALPQPRRIPLQHNPLCAPDAGCRSCGMRRARARTPHWRPKYNAWTTEHHDWLRVHAGEASIPELARRISVAFGIARTDRSLHFQAWRIGISLLTAHLTVDRVAYYCGVHRSTVMNWVRWGWLDLPDWVQNRPRNGDIVIPRETLEVFVQRCAHHLIPSRMPRSPYQQIVAACWAKARWLTTVEVARYTGVHPRTVARWLAEGRCPGQQAHRQGTKRIWLVRARDLSAWLRQREAA